MLYKSSFAPHPTSLSAIVDICLLFNISCPSQRSFESAHQALRLCENVRRPCTVTGEQNSYSSKFPRHTIIISSPLECCVSVSLLHILIYALMLRGGGGAGQGMFKCTSQIGSHYFFKALNRPALSLCARLEFLPNLKYLYLHKGYPSSLPYYKKNDRPPRENYC